MTNLGASLQKNAGVTQIDAAWHGAAEIVTGTSFPRNQFAQATIVTKTDGQPWLCILMDTSGNGYCAFGASIWKFTAGSGTSLVGGSGVVAGEVWKFASDSAGHLTTYKNATQQSTVTDTTYTSGSPGLWLAAIAVPANQQVGSFTAGTH
jgi:hypothetical protein